MVAIEVLDTGPGIPEEKRALIFKEFQRLDETASSVKGLGLGLAIVERICRVLGTPISVHSRLGHGSRFTVDVPVAEAASWQKRVEPQQDRSTGLGVNLGGMLVVCIDNEPDVLNGMRLLLTGWGCNVLLASSPETAAQAVTSAGQVPEVILADYHLDKATGLDAIAAVRKAARTPIPAVIITADQSPGLQKAIRAAGYGLLSKPLKAGALRAILAQQALRRAAAE